MTRMKLKPGTLLRCIEPWNSNARAVNDEGQEYFMVKGVTTALVGETYPCKDEEPDGEFGYWLLILDAGVKCMWASEWVHGSVPHWEIVKEPEE